MLRWVQVSGGTYRVNRRLSYAIGSGRVSFSATNQAVLSTLADGEHLGEELLLQGHGNCWEFTAAAVTPCILFSMSRQDLQKAVRQSAPLREQLAQ